MVNVNDFIINLVRSRFFVRSMHKHGRFQNYIRRRLLTVCPRDISSHKKNPGVYGYQSTRNIKFSLDYIRKAFVLDSV